MSDTTESTNEQSSTNDSGALLTGEATEEKVDYSYVPDKFMKDGEPNFENLSKSYTELEKKLQSSRPLAPESIDGYQFSEDNPFPYEDQLDADSFKQFKEQALEMGITNDQYNFIMNYYGQRMDELPHLQDHREALQAKWGDQFDAKIKAANNAVAKYFPEGDISKYPELANHPVLTEMLANIGSASKESVTTNDKTGSVPKSSYSELEIQEMMKSSDYHDNATKQNIVRQYFQTQYG